MGNTIKITYIVLAAGFFLCALGCTGGRSPEIRTQAPVFTVYQDIPGITSDEIEAIEALKRRNASFTYGAILSTETFYDETGEIRGFGELFCVWLSDLFGIRFEPAIYEWSDLLAGIRDHSIDFTGELTATPERGEIYFMTDAIAERSIKYMRLAGSAPFSTIAAERSLRYAFLNDAVTADLVLPSVRESGEAVFVDNYDTAYDMLKSGAIDAFFDEGIPEAVFDTYNDVVTEDFFPLTYVPVSFATGNPSLKPVVSALQKALQKGAGYELINLYDQGQRKFMRSKFFSLLNDQEREYVRRHSSPDNPVPVVMQHDNYPVSFYNDQEKQWQGIAPDVLAEIEALSGLYFRRVNDEAAEWPELLSMLEDGRAAMVTELIRSEDREGRYLWAGESYQTDNYALLSKSSFPDIRINEILYTRVGLVRGTAYAELFRNWFPTHANTVEYPSVDDSFTALERGDVDLVMMTRNLLLGLTNYREQAGYKANVVFKRAFNATFGFNPGEKVLKSIVDKALRIIDTDGIENHWTSKIFDYRKKLAQSRRPFLIGLSCLLFFVLVLLFILFQRKRQAGRRLEQLIQDRTMELVRQDRLLHGVNDLAVILLESNADDLKKDLDRGVEMIARCVNADRVYVWRNNVNDTGQLSYSKIYGWEKDKNEHYDTGMEFTYQETFPEWQKKLSRGKSINGPLNSLSEKEYSRLTLFGIKSILIIPVFLRDDFWGFISLEDCSTERRFSEEEESILRSGSLMIVTAIQRNEMSRNIKNTVAKLEAVISNYTGIIWSVTREGIISLFNGLYLKKIGVAPGFFEGKELEEARLKDRYVDIIKNVEETISLGPQEWVSEIDGSMFHNHAAPMHDGDGNIVGVVGTTDDITTTIKLQRDLEQALEAAKAASRAKSDFLANMSHEIRTPMNAIIGMTTIAKDADDINRKDYCLLKIENASNHLLGVINDILDMSKIEANKFELSPVEFCFEKMLQQVVNVINFRIDEKEQKFSVRVDRAIPHTLIGDDQRLAQVITNLLSNAVKFTPEHGSVSLDTSFVKEENGVCTIRIEVSDTGIGISQEQQERLFNSFQQAESSTSRKFGGTGLGLAISKRIVEMMGGTIWIDSRPGAGSKFIFTVQAGLGAEEKREHPASHMKWNNVRILMVDDDKDAREYFSEIVQRCGIPCDTASGGKEALALIEQKGAYDLYFLDWKMPDMDGIELTRRVKETGGDRCVVIMVSAAAWSAVEDDAKQVGVNKFLSKPLFPSTVVDLINDCLGADDAPADGARPGTLPGKQPAELDNFKGYRILLAEDVEINREIVLTLLEPTGLAIDCAENGEKALRLFREAPDRYDMIFMDVQMPEMDGYEATRRIRAFEKKWRKKTAPESPETIPIIAMTANVFREDIEKCMAAGMNGHVGKPLDFDEVLASLRKNLKSHDERRISG